MILTDREIKNSLAAGLIKITPEPAADAYDSTSVDLTLDKVIRVFKASTNGLEINVDPGAPGFKARELLPQVTDQREIPPEGYTLKPKVLILAWTAEIKAPTARSCRCESRRKEFTSTSWPRSSCDRTYHSCGLRRSHTVRSYKSRTDTDKASPRVADMPANLRTDSWDA